MNIQVTEGHTNKHKIMYPDTTIKLTTSVSEQNLYFTYVCMVNDINPTSIINEHDQLSCCYLDGEAEEIAQEEEPIQVERSKALHELVESHKKENDISDRIELKEDDSVILQASTLSNIYEYEDKYQNDINANILKLTKMKWLTENQDKSPDSSSPSISPTNSSTSTNCSRESEGELEKRTSVNDKYLSTILRLDKEHNMFGLSNMTIVESRPLKKIRKEDRAVFHQTAIVQVCCGNKCCKHMSKTDLPMSLKCGGCADCCVDRCCILCPPSICSSPCDAPCLFPSCSSTCISCPGGKYCCKIAVKRKPIYDPAPVELTPRSSCVLQKPLAARSCHHIPSCLPPSSCFPYLMPCYWPSRAGAPCNTPSHCFHNPPCRAPRRPQPKLGPSEMCPPGAKCLDNKQKQCENVNCLGNIPDFKKEFQSRFGATTDPQTPAAAASKK